MLKEEKALLNACKDLIEKKLKWPESAGWRQRDFLNLISLIEKESQITLSLTTIKRLWKPDYSGTPQPGTLDAMAKYLGYSGWLDFAENHQSRKESKPKIWKTEILKRSRPYLLASTTALGLLFIGFNYKYFSSKPSLSKASLTVKNAAPANVPNTVIFSYSLDGVEADSFFIQQSWNKFRREWISKTDSIHTSTYFYPGAHRASLIADDKTVAETTVKIKTDDWIAAARFGLFDNVPIYLNTRRSRLSGILSISPDQLLQNQIKLKSNLFLSYYYVNDFDGLDKSNFQLKVRLKNDSIVNAACPQLSMMILGTNNMYFVPLTTPGCIGNINLILGDKVQKGKNTNLSAFGVDIYDWHTIEFKRLEDQYEIWLDKHLIHTTSGAVDIGEIIGVNMNFTGSGSLDFVELGDSKTNEIIYQEDFEASGPMP